MAEPTLQEVFGANATQSATDIVIKKADLASTGLVAAVDNKAEQLFVGMLLRSAATLTEASRQSDQSNRNVTVYYGGQDLTGNASTGTFRRDAYSVLLYKPRALDPVSPSDY